MTHPYTNTSIVRPRYTESELLKKADDKIATPIRLSVMTQYGRGYYHFEDCGG